MLRESERVGRCTLCVYISEMDQCRFKIRLYVVGGGKYCLCFAYENCVAMDTLLVISRRKQFSDLFRLNMYSIPLQNKISGKQNVLCVVLFIVKYFLYYDCLWAARCCSG